MTARPFRLIPAVALLVAAAAGPAAAQMPDGTRFAVSAGAAVPLGDFADAAKAGYTFGAQMQFPIGERFAVRVNGDWTHNTFSTDVSDLIGDGHWTQVGLMANAVWPVNQTGMYLLGGLGFYSVDSNAPGSDAESDLAYNVGAGVGRGRWFLEARYQSIQIDPAMNSMPIVFGWKF